MPPRITKQAIELISEFIQTVRNLAGAATAKLPLPADFAGPFTFY
jgi:hypothetical protein